MRHCLGSIVLLCLYMPFVGPNALKMVLLLQVRMAPSQAKHKLFVGNIPKAYTQEEVERQLNLVVKGWHSQAGCPASGYMGAEETQAAQAALQM